MKEPPAQAEKISIQLPGKGYRFIGIEKRQVIKRDARTVPWDASKITRAIALAFYDVRHSGAANPFRNDAAACYGLTSEDFLKAMAITHRVSQMLELTYQKGRHPSIEEVQDTVEMAIAAEGEWTVARAYILYRQKKADLRLHHYEDNGLADYIAMAKYVRYRPDLGRRETFPEAVARVEAMHLKRFKKKKKGDPFLTILSELAIQGEIDENVLETVRGFFRDGLDLFSEIDLSGLICSAFGAVRDKKVLPSMRSLQFGGKAIEAANARMFNCSFSSLDRLSFFSEYLYLLLAGVGCGFSVQKHHVELLPALPARPGEMDLPVRHHIVEDTIEGWGDAVDALLASFFDRLKVEFSFVKIRPRGTPLKTSGGKAPGHLPLKRALASCEKILQGAGGRKLKPVEAYDICMYLAKAVLAGGVRRSATICLFSPDDDEMMTAKTGDWFSAHPQRSASNNSAVIERDASSIEEFKKLFEMQKEFGEPGFYFTNHRDYGCNPCCEIGLHPLVTGPVPEADKARLRELGYEGELGEHVRLSGWQMCNLTTINGTAVHGEKDFYQACFWAASIGTLQAAYTDMPYLGPVSRFLNERESLLGVSICGILDNPEIFLDPDILTKGAAICRAVNRVVAKKIGIRPAARVTCVKPEGTASLLLGSGSGLHPHHAKRYFRRVQANRNEPVYRHFKQANPHMAEVSVYNPETDDVITFPVEASETAILRDEITALSFLDTVRLVQRYWVQEGQASEEYSPKLHHNVSNTCTVKPEEWDAVADFVWQNREYFTGVSLLAYSGDKVYIQAPREEVTTDEDIARWNRLKYQSIDYTSLREGSDETNLKEVIACAGGACEL
ncbi:MAG: ATP cone domain-containing protein [Opitutales bacterium]